MLSADLLSIIEEAGRILDGEGQQFGNEQKRLLEIKNRLIDGRFNIAILGQFKRGKSTLINALIGEDILPSDVIPLTSAPTFLSWGQNRRICVEF